MFRSLFIALLLGSMPLLDAVGQSWMERAPLPEPRAGLNAVALDGYIYVIGGGRITGQKVIQRPLETVLRYDPAADTWDEDMAPMAEGRANAAAVVLDGEIYVIGGHDKNGAEIDDVDVFNPNTNQWRKAAGLNLERQGHTAVVLDGRIYVIGGANGEETLDSIEYYAPEDDEWTLSDDLKLDRPRVEHATVVVDDTAYSFGGISRVPLSTGVRFHPQRGVEVFVPPGLLRERSSLGAAVHGDSIYILGGRSGGAAGVLDDVVLFVPAISSIDEHWAGAPRMQHGRENFATASVNGTVYALGGFDDKQTLSSVESFDPDEASVGIEDPEVVAQLRLAQNHPNPFTTTTTIEFVVPGAEPQPVSLSVYDVHGRPVADLIEQYLPPGRHQVEWDGRSAVGGPAASGVYLYVLRHNGRRIAATMTLLR